MILSRSTAPGASWSDLLLLLVSFLSLAGFSSSENNQYVRSTDSSGNTIYLEDNRKPAIYTQNFGDCLGSSLINVTRFNVAYYADNMTVLFDLAGNTNVANESVMRSYPIPFISDESD